MKIKKILNNNVAIATDVLGKECIVTGRGIVFAKRIGDKINEQGIEKIFVLKEKGITEKVSRIIENIPFDHLKVCDEIINMAKRELPDLGEKIYLTLIDHISYAIDRHKENLDLVSSVKWELREFYPNEYHLGERMLDIIDKRLHIRLPEDEAAFIAFHLVNARNHVNINLEESLQLVTKILEIIRNTDIDYDENAVSYGRLLIHLKFFSRRVIGSNILGMDKAKSVLKSGRDLLRDLEIGYPRENSCVKKICSFIEESYKYHVKDEEKAYLLIHLHGLIKEK
jgi:beta-glucoside operon transcriptional antiterminator